jgi:trimethylamine--corrinoid protein Co-methyltransferase
MLDGSMVSSLEQLLVDVEIFRFAGQGHRGVVADDEKWLTNVIKNVGPGGNYLCEPSTLSSIRGDEWFISELGVHGSYEHWQGGGSSNFLEELKDRVDQILTHHETLPLDEEVDLELNKICERAQK